MLYSNSKDSSLFDQKLKETYQEELIVENNNFDQFMNKMKEDLHNIHSNVNENEGKKVMNKDYSMKNINPHEAISTKSFFKAHNDPKPPNSTRANKEITSTSHTTSTNIEKPTNKILNKYDDIHKLFNNSPKKNENNDNLNFKKEKNFDFDSILNQVDKQNILKNKKEYFKNQEIKEMNKKGDQSELLGGDNKFIYPVGGNKLRNKK